MPVAVGASSRAVIKIYDHCSIPSDQDEVVQKLDADGCLRMALRGGSSDSKKRGGWIWHLAGKPELVPFNTNPVLIRSLVSGSQ